MLRIAAFLTAFCLMPALVLATTSPRVDYIYPNPSIFAWAGTSCPRGSAPISDPVYRNLGRQSDVVYCLFPAREVGANADGSCPEGFERIGRGRCADRRGRP